MLIATGSMIGLVLGLAHAAYVYQKLSGYPPSASPSVLTTPAFYAVFTLILWVLFGTYVLVLWLIAIPFFLLFKAFR